MLVGLLAGCPPANGPLLGTNTDLEDLTLSSGSFSPAFATDTTTYRAFLTSGTGSITVTPTAADPNAKIEVRCDGGGWAEVLSGSACPSLIMYMGMNMVRVRVTAEDSIATKTYVITAYRGILVPDEFTTIQAAIDETADGDWVLVRPDTYTENIEFPADVSITVRSKDGADSTTIDGGASDSVVTFSTSNASSELDGFTITNGYTASAGGAAGGGIHIYQCSPTITNCIITGNSTDLYGAGIYCEDASPTLTGCTFVNGPPSIYNMGGASAVVTNCIFWQGTVSSHMVVDDATASSVVTYCAFHEKEILPPGDGNILINNPLFLDQATGDFHLEASSPCIDVGNNSADDLPDTDIDGDARIINGTVDIGADEYSP